MNTEQELLLNAAQRRLERMFPGFFNTSAKHNIYTDFGYPEDITFEQLYRLYDRNPIAAAVVDRPVDKRWQDDPWLLQGEDTHTETPVEATVRREFERLRFWDKLKEVAAKARVGKYGALLFRFRDGKKLSEPVERVNGLANVHEIVTLYESQLKVASWNTDPEDEDFGQPTMFMLNTSHVGNDDTQEVNVAAEVHPSRVFIWSDDGSVNGRSALKQPYNNIIDLEKIMGAGGEGFWRNAKNAPVLNMQENASRQSLAQELGTTPDKVGDTMSDLMDGYSRGFDSYLMFKNIDAKQLQVELEDPGPFVLSELQAIAAGVPIPLKILVGSQSGERASTEDANEFAQTAMGWRARIDRPNIMAIVKRFVEYGILPSNKEWIIKWSDLTEMRRSAKIEMVSKMAETNKNNLGGGIVFTADEMREEGGYEPLADADAGGGDDDDEDEE